MSKNYANEHPRNKKNNQDGNIKVVKRIISKNEFSRRNGINPFKTSKHNTPKARYLFPVRRTLVAPTFPEPIFLISPRPNNFVSINAKGTDPSR